MMNTIGKTFTLLSLFSLIACQAPSPEGKTENQEKEKQSDHLTAAVLWLQKGETARLAREQAYDYAYQLVSKRIQGEEELSKLAVVLDLDETVVDNSPYEARVIQAGTSFEMESWSTWVQEANADDIPGALNFLNQIDSLGLSIYYISNRSVKNLAPTLENLHKLGVPQADSSHVLLRGEDSDKGARRAMVAEQHEIILLVGDQIGDFASDFESEEAALSGKIVVIPNPMYGDFTRMPDSIKNQYPSLGEALKSQLNPK